MAEEPANMTAEFVVNLKQCLKRCMSDEDAGMVADDIVPILERQGWRFYNRSVELQRAYEARRREYRLANPHRTADMDTER